MNAQMQTFIVMLMVLIALIYVAIKAKKRLTAKIIVVAAAVNAVIE
jgi:nucleoside recognition membrane protein YjiH